MPQVLRQATDVKILSSESAAVCTEGLASADLSQRKRARQTRSRRPSADSSGKVMQVRSCRTEVKGQVTTGPLIQVRSCQTDATGHLRSPQGTPYKSAAERCHSQIGQARDTAYMSVAAGWVSC